MDSGVVLNERLRDDVSAGEGGGVPQGTLSDLTAELSIAVSSPIRLSANPLILSLQIFERCLLRDFLQLVPLQQEHLYVPLENEEYPPCSTLDMPLDGVETRCRSPSAVYGHHSSHEATVDPKSVPLNAIAHKNPSPVVK